MIDRLLPRISIAALLALTQLLAPASSLLAQEPAAASRQQSAPQAETLGSLQSRIGALISQARYAPAAWGIKIVSLDTGATVFEHNPQKYFNPASNAKLYTSALALDRLGGDYRIKTSLYSTARPDSDGTIKGDLVVYGRGDPTLTARLYGGDYYKPLVPLADALVSAGVRRIEGDLIGDESYFVGPPFGSGWEAEDLQWYDGAEVSALTINDNVVDLFVRPAERAGLPCRVTTGPQTSHVTLMNRTQTVARGGQTRIGIHRPVGENVIYITGQYPVGSSGYAGRIAVHNPAGLFASLFKEALARRGISVTGRARSVDWKYREVTPIDFSKLVELGAVSSPPLAEIVRETMKPSQNLYAQLLLLQVGINASPARARDEVDLRTTEGIAVEALGEFLTRVGLRRGEVVLEEGSGLSRKDLITASATVALLGFMDRHRLGETYRSSLPIAGVDGTLTNRMKSTAAAGNARAKTGTLSYVYTLSGYVTTAAGERLAFSILLNNYFNADRAGAQANSSSPGGPTRPPNPRDDIDAIVVMLAAFSGRSQ